MKKHNWIIIPLVAILLSGCFTPRPVAAGNTPFKEAYAKYVAQFLEMMQNIDYEMGKDDKPVLKHADIDALRANLAVLTSFTENMIMKATTDQEKYIVQMAFFDCMEFCRLSYLEEERELLPEYDAERASDAIENLLLDKELYTR